MAVTNKSSFYVGGFRVDSGGSIPRSRLGEMLEQLVRRKAKPKDLTDFITYPGNLKGLTASEAKTAIGLVMREDNSHSGRRAIVHMLRALSSEDRGQALRLMDGQANTRRVGYLLHDTFGESRYRGEVLDLVNEARPRMAARDGFLVLSDIDDTVKPHDGRRVFPGAAAFFRALDGRIAGDVHFVTARSFDSAKDTEHVLRGTGIEFGSVAYGDWDQRLRGEEKQNAIEDSKYRNATELFKRNPTGLAVLIGDDTQRDPRVFLRLLQSHGSRVGLVLIHRVRHRPIPDELLRDPRVHVFDSYAGAAQETHRRGFINRQQLEEVLKDG